MVDAVEKERTLCTGKFDVVFAQQLDAAASHRLSLLEAFSRR